MADNYDDPADIREKTIIQADNKEWAKDAHGGKLSHSKMLQEIDMRHPRVEKEDGGKKSWPIFTTHTGCWNCCGIKKWQKSDINVELGAGLSIYFRQMKFLACMFFLFSILSIPSLYLYSSASGNGIEGINDIKGLFSMTSLGNLGRIATEPCTSNWNMTTKAAELVNGTFFCQYGKMTDLLLFGAASGFTNHCGP
jgi:hypothetical protein